MFQQNFMAKKELTYIDIFAGCGGMSLGLYKAGWRGLFAIEKDPMAFQTLKYNLIDKRKHFDWPKWLPTSEHDIKEVIKNYRDKISKLKGKVKLVVGGPPCQGFSMAGRRNESDARNKMIDFYIEFIKLVQPKMLFFENVRGFTLAFGKNKSKGETYSNYVLEKLKEIGYNVHGEILDFSEFGVPQRRKRFILVGIRNGNPIKFFKLIIKNKAKFLKNKRINDRITVEEAISDLLRSNGELNSKEFKQFKEGVYSKPKSNYQRLLRKRVHSKVPDSHRFPNHKTETITRFLIILKNYPKNKKIVEEIKNKYNLKKRNIAPLEKGKKSPTLTTLPDDYIHYSEPRILTVREYARIQSFDDDFEFKGKYTTGGKLRKFEVPRYTQVGNAIPPLFGEQSGIILKNMVIK